MTHWASRAADLDSGTFRYYRIRVALDAEELRMVDDVARVVYHLHPTFRHPNRESRDRSSAFDLRTAGWGEFNMTAEVYSKGNAAPLVIERYINFLPPAA
ncbi:MAG TPA: pYEATS domain-containing protein [Gemmatirosa sp.]